VPYLVKWRISFQLIAYRPLLLSNREEWFYVLKESIRITGLCSNSDSPLLQGMQTGDPDFVLYPPDLRAYIPF
jgi:hypothetical protein